jgi:hypothetical protein
VLCSDVVHCRECRAFDCLRAVKCCAKTLMNRMEGHRKGIPNLVFLFILVEDVQYLSIVIDPMNQSFFIKIEETTMNRIGIVLELIAGS